MERGSRISHYEIAEKLGQGGMGVVYKAWDHKLRRMVALKFLPASAAGEGAQAARFHQEALAVSALNHPNIATIYDIEEAEGHPFLALEYLPGGTLQSALDQLRSAGQQISLEQGLEYAIQIAEALAHAHQNGVIHRDVKTANVMFAQSGAVKLTDFGLAKTAESSGVTRTGTVMGTPATMSPEQARGHKTDERSDIFSAGAVLFELFTGHLPFHGDNPASVLYQVVHEEAPALSRFRPGIPPALEQIVSRALKKDPGERYQTAAGLASDLRELHRELLTGSPALAADHAARRGDLETVVLAAGRGTWDERTGLSAASGAGNGVRGWRRICSHRSILTITSLAAIAAAALGLWWAWPEPETRLAILPFENLGANASDQALAEGFREALIGKLAGLERPKGLLVMNVSKSQMGSKEIGEPSDARRRLGANLVMTGELIRTGPRPQLVVQLEDPETLEPRAETIDVESGDLSAATGDVVKMLNMGIGARLRLAREPGGSSNPQATRFYVEGRGHLQHDGELDVAAQAFQDAVAKDPKFALAWVGLAEAKRRKYNLRRDGALLEEAGKYASQALKLASGLAEAHIVMAQIQLDRGDHGSAEQELNTALKIEPANASAYQVLGDLYLAQNEYVRAEKTYQHAIEMRPGDPEGYNRLGSYYYHRNQDELLPNAERQFLNTLQLAAPDNYRAHYNLGAVYFRMERYRDAIEHFNKSLLIAPSVNGYSNLGTVYYYAGLYDDAAEEYRKAAEGARSNYEYWGSFADACRWAGREDEAAVNYRKAIDLLKADPHVNPALQHATLAMYHVSIRHRGALAAEDRQQARKEIEMAARLESQQPDAPHAEIGFLKVLVYAQTGDLDQAFEALAQLQKTASAELHDIERTPALKEFRKDRRFGRIAGLTQPRP
jgi:eukaryotic-like serine/threonine-protein kinase